jgi:hypothetical protein
MTSALVSHLVIFMPVIVTLSGWTRAYRKRRTEQLHPFALTLLAAVTGLAAIAAASFVYFDFRPVHLPPWQSPEVMLFGWLFILGPACMAVGFLALGKQPKWLFWVLELASLWLTGLGVLGSSAY